MIYTHLKLHKDRIRHSKEEVIAVVVVKLQSDPAQTLNIRP
jgi:hypothetical protein